MAVLVHINFNIRMLNGMELLHTSVTSHQHYLLHSHSPSMLCWKIVVSPALNQAFACVAYLCVLSTTVEGNEKRKMHLPSIQRKLFYDVIDCPFNLRSPRATTVTVRANSQDKAICRG